MPQTTQPNFETLEKEIIEAFSQEKINSMGGAKNCFKNIQFVQAITPKLLLLEFFIRNAVSRELESKQGEAWIRNETDAPLSQIVETILFILNDKNKRTQSYSALLATQLSNLSNKSETKYLSNYIQEEKLKFPFNINDASALKRRLTPLIISNQSFGFWVKKIDKHNLKILKDHRQIDLTKYNLPRWKKAKDAYKKEEVKNKMVASTLLKIRNRAFHNENLLSGERLTCTIRTHRPSVFKQGLCFGIQRNAKDIDAFLSDCIRGFGLSDIAELLKKESNPLLDI